MSISIQIIKPSGTGQGNIFTKFPPKRQTFFFLMSHLVFDLGVRHITVFYTIHIYFWHIFKFSSTILKSYNIYISLKLPTLSTLKKFQITNIKFKKGM